MARRLFLAAAFVLAGFALTASAATPALVPAMLADAEPRVVVGTSDQVAMLDAVRRDGAAQPLPAWVLVDPAPADEAAGWLSYATLREAASDEPPCAHVEAGDLLTVMYTSGTTGMPKGICHTHFIRAMYAALLSNAWRMAPESVYADITWVGYAGDRPPAEHARVRQRRVEV